MSLPVPLAPLALLAFAFDVWAVINIGESRAPRPVKAAWTALVMLAPFIGFIAWLATGPRSARRSPF